MFDTARMRMHNRGDIILVVETEGVAKFMNGDALKIESSRPYRPCKDTPTKIRVECNSSLNETTAGAIQIRSGQDIRAPGQAATCGSKCHSIYRRIYVWIIARIGVLTVEACEFEDRGIVPLLHRRFEACIPKTVVSRNGYVIRRRRTAPFGTFQYISERLRTHQGQRYRRRSDYSCEETASRALRYAAN